MTSAFMPPLFGEGLDGARLWNALMALCGETLPLGTAGATVAFAPAPAPEAQEHCIAVALGSALPPLVVAFRDFPFKAAFGTEFEFADLPGLPDELRVALHEGLRAFATSLLPGDIAARLAVVAEGSAAELATGMADDVEWLALRMADSRGLHVDLVVGWPRGRIVDHLGRSLSAGEARTAALGDHYQVPAYITLGSITLPLRELGEIEPGAVVVLAETGGEGLRMRVGDLVFGFVEIDEGWRCTGGHPLERNRPRAAVHARKGTAMDDEIQPGEVTSSDVAAGAAGDGDRPLSIGDMTVAIDFDLGRSMVPLSMVAGWKPGQVIDVGAPSAESGVAVTIRANGDIVGQGDVVRIDDRIGVRITRFFLRT